jgi:hypothetical protein
MSKRAKSLAILACAVLMFSCPTYSQNTVQEDKVENKSDNLSRKRPKRKGDLSERPDVQKSTVEDDQDVLYRPPAIVEFLGIPFGMDIDKFSGMDVVNSSGKGRGSYFYDIPKDRIVVLHPLLELVTARGNGFTCKVLTDSHQKIVRATCGRNSFTAGELREFIDKIRKEYPEIEEIKNKAPYDRLSPLVATNGTKTDKKPTTNHRLFGTTKSGISVEFIRNSSPIVRESDGELIYNFVLILAYEAPIKAEEDRQARIKRKIAESDF